MLKEFLLSSVIIAGSLGISTTQVNANNDHGWGSNHPGEAPWIITDEDITLPWGGGFPWESNSIPDTKWSSIGNSPLEAICGAPLDSSGSTLGGGGGPILPWGTGTNPGWIAKTNNIDNPQGINHLQEFNFIPDPTWGPNGSVIPRELGGGILWAFSNVGADYPWNNPPGPVWIL